MHNWGSKFRWLVGLPVAVLICLAVLLRGAIFVIGWLGLNVWLALATSGVFAVFLLMGYLIVLYRKLFNRWPFRFGLLRIKASFAALTLIGGCCFLGVQFSQSHAKSASVYEEVAALHPLLRLSVGAIMVFDKQMLITDIARNHREYRDMGLPTNTRSLHFPQRDGYVYAVDIRTVGRNWLRNGASQLYFWAMGFHAIRHHGTADHLHISLSPHWAPGVK